MKVSKVSIVWIVLIVVALSVSIVNHSRVQRLEKQLDEIATAIDDFGDALIGEIGEAFIGALGE